VFDPQWLSNPKPQYPLSRRQLLQWSSFSGLGLLMGGCGTTLLSETVGKTVEPLNERLGALLLSQKPVPEYPVSAIEPSKLLINTFDTTPQIDPLKFQLTVNGAVKNPLVLKMTDLQKLPLTSMVIQHVCVEGWAAIVQWGGVRLRDLVTLAQPQSNARYIYFKSADGYYESWDIASALHPQTLMAYQKNGQPLSADNGAPLRLASPVKLGYKLSKWVTQITLVDQLMPTKGYWEDQGYEWFGGI
jgi:DMSO/TMAO reductase YedYZ molybdopterin-dependent catalytic subunit